MRVVRRDTDEVAMNMAPLIDVVFLLLVFFMVATTYVDREKELGVDLPTAESGEEAGQAPEEIVINLMSDGRIVVSGEEMTRESLSAYLQNAARKDAETPVTIRGDKGALLEALVSIMDVCRLAGLQNLGVMTRDG